VAHEQAQQGEFLGSQLDAQENQEEVESFKFVIQR
jgi:hypothetical protein